MDEKVLKSMAVKSVAFMAAVLLVSRGMTGDTDVRAVSEAAGEEPFSYTEASNRLFLDQISRQLAPEKEQNARRMENVRDYLGSRYLVIAKGTEQPVSITQKDIYMNKAVQVTVAGLPDKNISYQSLERYSGGNLYTGLPVSGVNGDLVKAVDIHYSYNTENFTYTAILDITLDHVYVQQLYEDDSRIYVDLQRPHEVYDKIVVVDAGHGGNAVGTYSGDMEYLEKDLNLSILLYLKEYLNNESFQVYYTRLDDTKVYLNPRINLANDVEADLFVSIHCNGDTDTGSYGIEALYNEKAPEKGMGSKRLSQICLEELEEETGLRSRGLKPRSDVYIIGKAKVPVTLLEVGFLSNPSDLAFLLKEDNRKKIAYGIYQGILKALQEEEEL